MLPAGFFSFASLQRGELTDSLLRMKLGAAGVRAGDVIGVKQPPAEVRHVQIGAGGIGGELARGAA